jgi:hypothetical protein
LRVVSIQVAQDKFCKEFHNFSCFLKVSVRLFLFSLVKTGLGKLSAGSLIQGKCKLLSVVIDIVGLIDFEV